MSKYILGKKGSSIVEAAIIFPFIIMIVLVVVTITIFFYKEGVSLSALHINLWEQSQIESLTGKDNKAFNTYAPTDPFASDVFYLESAVEKRIGLLFAKIKAYTYVSNEKTGIFSYSSGKRTNGQIYIINEMEYIRCYDSMIRKE